MRSTRSCYNEWTPANPTIMKPYEEETQNQQLLTVTCVKHTVRNHYASNTSTTRLTTCLGEVHCLNIRSARQCLSVILGLVPEHSGVLRSLHIQVGQLRRIGIRTILKIRLPLHVITRTRAAGVLSGARWTPSYTPARIKIVSVRWRIRDWHSQYLQTL